MPAFCLQELGQLRLDGVPAPDGTIVAAGAGNCFGCVRARGQKVDFWHTTHGGLVQLLCISHAFVRCSVKGISAVLAEVSGCRTENLCKLALHNRGVGH
jgi:hypothetical protein